MITTQNAENKVVCPGFIDKSTEQFLQLRIRDLNGKGL